MAGINSQQALLLINQVSAANEFTLSTTPHPLHPPPPPHTHTAFPASSNLDFYYGCLVFSQEALLLNNYTVLYLMSTMDEYTGILPPPTPKKNNKKTKQTSMPNLTSDEI